LRIASDNFDQVGAAFDSPGMLNHDATRYLSHPNVIADVWRPLAGAAGARAFDRLARSFATAIKKPQRRALLVGINNYPDPANRLEGCVNDVFLMSSVLQETGFAPEDIRVILDERATAAELRDRMEWLLEGAGDGQHRVLFYSGHGAQIPGYGIGEKVDHDDECLVPYDFDWSREKAFTDDQFYDLYSQLPYGSHFMAILDCCHAGGMTRDGARVRGLTPPDDIRHRLLRWNAARQMWGPRDLPPVSTDLKNARAYTGPAGVTRRLGRSVVLRSLPDKQYDAVRKALGHHGPYLPIIFQACQEDQLAREYRHGVTSYGAFTYTLAATLRRQRRRRITFDALLRATGVALEELGYDQRPAVVGPRKWLAQPVPWHQA
jgi:metacaspase-1